MFYRIRYALLFTLSLCISADLHADLLIKNVRIINKEGVVSEPSNVYIQGGSITTIAKAIKAQPSDQILDGRSRFLIPGLIDSHVHLTGVPGESDAIPKAVRLQAIQQIPRSYLYFGFTSVLDLISSDDAILQWNQQPIAPSAYHCAGVPIPGGYPLASLPQDNQLTHPAAQFYLFDPRQKELMSTTRDSSHHKVKPLVNAIAKTQARCIKAFYEKGFGPLQNLPVPSIAMMKGLIKEANKYDLPVFVHGNSKEAHEFTIDSGAQMLAHGVWHGIDSHDLSTIKQLALGSKTQDIAVQPTIQVIYGEGELFNTDFFENLAVKKAMPAQLIDWYQSKSGQWFVERMSNNLGQLSPKERTQAFSEKFNLALENVRAHTRALLAEGVKLQFGSDTPSGPLYTQFPGFNGREEITRWAETGVPLKTLFQALTYRNAELLGLENTIGSVEEGKQADLLLLKQNPLENVNAYDSIEWVILKGEAMEREQLAAKNTRADKGNQPRKAKPL